MYKSGVCHLHGCGKTLGATPALLRLRWVDAPDDVLEYCGREHAQTALRIIQKLRAGRGGDSAVQPGKKP